MENGVGFSEKDLPMNHKLLCENAISHRWKKTNVLRCLNRKMGCVWCNPAVFGGWCSLPN